MCHKSNVNNWAHFEQWYHKQHWHPRTIPRLPHSALTWWSLIPARWWNCTHSFLITPTFGANLCHSYNLMWNLTCSFTWPDSSGLLYFWGALKGEVYENSLRTAECSNHQPHSADHTGQPTEEVCLDMSSGPRTTFPTSAVRKIVMWYMVLYWTVIFGTPSMYMIITN